MNENEFSSPDPLAGDDSVFKPAAKKGPVKAPRTRPTQKSSPIKQSSPTKQTFELDVGNEISPQKIRVTVEAGSENARIQRADRGFSSPSPSRRPVNRRGERTTTTTIPLAGLSDTENEVEPEGATPKRGRGRPRKAGTPVGGKGKGRAGTPVNEKSLSKRKSIGDLVDGDDSADNDFRIGKGVEVGRGKGRSRSGSKKGASRRSTPAASDKVASSVTSKRGRRKSLAPEEVVVLQDETGLEDHMGFGQGIEDGVDVLASIDPNVSYPASEHQDEERSGYPSPNVGGTPSIPNSSRQSDKYPLPERSQFAEESIATSHYPSPEKSQDGQADEDLAPDQEEGYYENEGGDADEEPQEFDTILESEGFSMISMDSVPSLRKHFSSPAFQERETPRETLQKRALTNSRNEAKSQGNSFSRTPAEGERSTKNQRSLLSVQRVQTDDSFSSVPPEVLEAATPGVKSHVSRLISTKHSRMEDSFSSVAPEILQAATPAKPLQSMPPTEETHDFQTYEDSFSAIPSAVLNEATPAPVRKTVFKTSSRPSSAKSSTNPPTALSAPETAMHLQPPRLPTPEDTPSPDEEIPNESLSTSNDKISISQPISQGMSNEIDVDESSVFPSQMKSSPPSLAPRRYKYGNHLQQQSLYPDLSHLTATPSIQFSSPSLPPPVQVHRGPDARNLAPLQLDRPALSPIARSGRALQDLIVPSSPRNRSSSLGSPFKSPLQERRSSTVSRDLQNEIDSRQESRGKPLPKLDLQGNLFPHLSSDFQARRQSGSSTQTQESSQSSRWAKPRQEEDPFSNVRTQVRSPSPEEKHGYSLDVPSQPGQRRRSDPSILNTTYGDNSVQSEDAMSWQADLNTSAGPNDATIRSSVHRRNPGESNQSWEDRWAAERATVSRQIESASTSQVIVLGSDDSQVSPTSRPNEDEDDGECYDLLLETINSSSPSIEQRQIEQQMYDNVEKPRRSKLPSPWRKNSKRLVYSDEISHFSSPFVGANALTRRGEENSAEPITVRRSSPEEVPARPISQKSNFAPRVRSNGSADLSALLGSPVKELPVLSSSSQESSLPVEKQPDSLSSRRQSGPSPGSMASERAKVDTATSSTQSFQPLQQKLGFRPRVRSSGTQDLSAFLNSPIKGLPVLEQTSPERNISPSMQGSSDSITESDVSDPSASSDKEASSGSSGLPYSSPTPFVPVPQKVGFTPRVRESRTSGISEKLLSSPVKPANSSVANNNPKENITALGVVSSSRINSSQVANCASSQVSLSTHGEDSYDAGGKTDQLYMDRPRGTDENTCMVAPQYKNLSPTKSILRSPVKPTFGEESAAKTVGWVSSSPSPSEEAAPLSPTTWSREHWDLLERIIDAWRPDGWSRDPTCPKLPSSTPNRRRSFNQTSVVSQLLGRVVSSQGEKMRLEQWHLEAVDEWREEVPGWEEGAICIRLLSLILGAERKINGTYGLRREMRARGENPDDPKVWAAAVAEVQARRANGM